MARLIEPPHGSGSVGPFERLVIDKLLRDLPDEYLLLSNFVIKESGRYGLEIDLVVLAPHAIYVIEAKEWYGRVSGDDTEWLLNGRPRRCLLEQVNHKAMVLKKKVGPYAQQHRFIELLIVPDKCANLLHGEWAVHLLGLSKAVRQMQHDRRFGLGGDRLVLEDQERLVRDIHGISDRRRRSDRLRIGPYRVEETLELRDDYFEYICSHALLDSKTLYRVRVWRLSSDLNQEQGAERLEVIQRPSQAIADMGVHPNLVQVRAFDELPDESAFYEVTEWTEAGTLHGYLRNQERDRLTLRHRLEIGTGVANALVAIHEVGVVHRNLCPESVLLGPGLRPLLTDFDRAFLPSGGGTVFAHTQPRNPAYVAPELADVRSYETNPKADLFALGALLYELFVGDPPFANAAAAIDAEGTPDRLPSEVRAGLPEDLDFLVLELLNVDRNDRPDAADAFVRLQEMLKRSDDTVSPQPEPEPNGSTDTFLLGEILDGKYRIDGELGEGGFSRVLKVWHFDHEQHYAMKLLIDGYDAETAIREFQTSQQLPAHPNIARTQWMDRLPAPHRIPYVLSEFIDGESLEPYSKGDKTLSLSQVRGIGLWLLDALAAMHPQTERINELSGRTLTEAEAQELMELRHKGILHRDIKPANILLDRWSGQPKIIDFNISAHYKTASGFAGTPRYWAPDRGVPEWYADADLFSLGVVLYELVTHQHPFPSDSPDAGEPLDPREVAGNRRGVGDAFADFLLKAVQSSRADRFSTAREMRDALETLDLLHAPAAQKPTLRGNYPGLTLSQEERERANYNPYVTRLLSLYSQASHTNAGTRGLDEIARLTYIRTRMDHVLAPAILDGQFRLVIITGNAGDGKTAFLEQLETLFSERGTDVVRLASDNGAEWTYGGVHFYSNYDGSQDEGDTGNDEVLAEFLQPFTGNSLAGLGSSEARLIAINEGRLRDFLFHSTARDEFKGLRRAVAGALDSGTAPPQGLLLVNLNLRALSAGGDSSIVAAQLEALLADELWAPCVDCDVAARCPLKHNADTLRDPASGAAVRRRLRRLFEIVHLRRQQHITMRDLRSALAWMLLRDHGCQDVHALLSREDAGPSDLAKLYYFEAFSTDAVPAGIVQDRAVRLLREVDVGGLEDPALDRRLHHRWATAVPWMAFDGRSGHCDEVVTALQGAALGVGASDDVRAVLHAQRGLIASLRRRAFFERRDEEWQDMLPYRALPLMEQAFSGDAETAARACDELLGRVIEAVSLLEGVRHPDVRGQFLCLRATRTRNASLLSFRLFPLKHFRILVQQPSSLERFIELQPDSITLLSGGELGHAEMRISLDLLEMLELIRGGYRPTAKDMRGLFVNLLIFRNELLHLAYSKVLVTQDGERFYEIAADQVGGLLTLSIEPRAAGDIGGAL